MKAPPFAYARARDPAEVFELLNRHGDEARILAGGQSLMPALNMRLSSPQLLIDITRLRQLAGIRVNGDVVHIGALTTHAEIERSADIRRHLPLLAEAARHIAHPAIRNSGTLGGSLALADPAAEWPACCVALNAQVVLQHQGGSRHIAARDFFHGLYATALQTNEMLTEVVIPIPAAGCRQVFLELARRRGDYAIVGVAALARITDGAVANLQLVFLGAGEKPIPANVASQVFDNKQLSDKTLTAMQAALAQDLDPVADLYHSAATKLHLARVLAARAVRQLVAHGKV